MTEAFPDVKIANFRIDLNENKARFESPFTRRRQVITLGAGTSDRWEGVITTPELYPADVQKVMNWMVKVGLYGLFTMPHPDYKGAASGELAGEVNGSGQSGNSLVVDGVSPNTLILREGEWFQVRNEFKRATADCTSDGDGEVVLVFKPALRVSPTDDDPVNFSSPKILCELLTPPSEDTNHLGMQSFQIAWQEAFSSE